LWEKLSGWVDILFILYVADIMNRDEWYNRIQSRIIINDNWCHVWQWAKNDSWYWVQKIDWKFWYTHRFLYDYIRWIDEWMTVDHMCKNTLCCNIEHLQLLTHKENALQWSIESWKKSKKIFCNIHNIERKYNERIKSYKCTECNKENRIKWSSKVWYTQEKKNTYNREYNKIYRQKNKEEIKQYKIEYREKNKERIKQNRRERYLLTWK
jgi:hypothetical protein